MYQTGAAAYQEARVLGSSKEQLVVLLYDQLLVNLRRAARQIEKDDVEGKSRSLSTASSIVYQLLETLNFDAGGEVASRLAALYAYLAAEIAEIGRTMDASRLERTIEMVDTLHDAWSQAARAIGQGQESVGPPAEEAS